jgi:hypothetical protein
MSNKLNAEELAAKRYPYVVAGVIDEWERHHHAGAYAAAIREVAQPIADERDELREVLGLIASAKKRGFGLAYVEGVCSAILAKYPKP